MKDVLEVFLNLGIFSMKPGRGHLEVAEKASSSGTFVILSGGDPHFCNCLKDMTLGHRFQ